MLYCEFQVGRLSFTDTSGDLETFTFQRDKKHNKIFEFSFSIDW
jgi:hypothetical protein